LALLLVAVAVDTAFAGRRVPFSQNTFNEEDVTVNWVEDLGGKVRINYTGNKTMPIGKMFLINVYGCSEKLGKNGKCLNTGYNGEVYETEGWHSIEIFNNESMIGNGKTYNLDVKTYKSKETGNFYVTKAYVWVGFSKKEIREYRNPTPFKNDFGGNFDNESETVAKEKKSWLERAFPPSKMWQKSGY